MNFSTRQRSSLYSFALMIAVLGFVMAGTITRAHAQTDTPNRGAW